MQSIIEDIYIKTLERQSLENLKNKQTNEPDKEEQTYEKLRSSLKESQDVLLEKFIELYADQQSENAEALYYCAFKTGFRLALEILMPENKR